MKLNFNLHERTIREGVTQSELSLFDECAIKWNYRYNNLLERADAFSWAFFVGGAWHNFQQKWRESKGKFDCKTFVPPTIGENIARDTEFENQLEYWSNVMPTFQQVYAKMYPEETTHPWHTIEKELTAEFQGWRIRGKIDLASDKPRFIRDFKSTASAWLITGTGWNFKLQFMLYCWLMVKNFPEWGEKPFEFQLDIMQKPALKQTKAETFPQHIVRVCKDIAERPEFYLRRTSYVITPDAIKHFETFVLAPKIARLELARNPENISIIANPNTNACSMYGNTCEFLDICQNGWESGQFFFTQRGMKHAEL